MTDALEGGLVVCCPVEEVRGGIALGDARNVPDDIEGEAEGGGISVDSNVSKVAGGEEEFAKPWFPPLNPRGVRTVPVC